MWLQVTCPWSQQPPPFPSPGPLQLIFLDLWGTPWATQPLSWLEVLTSASLRNHVYSGASLSLTCFWFQTCRYWAENPNSKFLQILAWHWLPRGLVAPRPSPGELRPSPAWSHQGPRKGVQQPQWYVKFRHRNFPGSPLAKTPRSQCTGPGFDSWSGN